MLKIIYSNKFKKDYKKIKNKDTKEKIKLTIIKIAKSEKLDKKYKNHKLKGNYKDYQECHITPDLLLIYKIQKDNIYLYRLGSHSDLFN